MRSLLPLLAILALVACNRKPPDEEAVRQGVIEYLSSRPGLNVASMTVQVTSMVVRQDQADATVSIAPKGGGGAQGMTMRYLLERKGSRWVVRPRANAGQNPHGGMGESPGGMPPGHPTVPPPQSSPQ